MRGDGRCTGQKADLVWGSQGKVLEEYSGAGPVLEAGGQGEIWYLLSTVTGWLC